MISADIITARMGIAAYYNMKLRGTVKGVVIVLFLYKGYIMCIIDKNTALKMLITGIDKS